ncbi:hypothetical protein MRX96_029970 [Rhipicephalus microplus]
MRHVRSLFMMLFTVRETRSPADSPMFLLWFEEASFRPTAAKVLGDTPGSTNPSSPAVGAAAPCSTSVPPSRALGSWLATPPIRTRNAGDV